jgi:hypothetical protein
MQLKPTSAGKAGTRSESWVDRVVDRIKPQPPDPKSPTPPPVDQTEWERSVDSHKVNTLTVHDVGLIVFNETESYADHDGANESVNTAREKIAHTLMNADSKFGAQRNAMARTASPIEPSMKALQDARTRQAYNSSLAAARDAYLSPTDPTHGATHFQFLTNADRSNIKFKKGSPEGLPLKTQSGPFDNSYLKNHVKSHRVWIDTYGAK